MANAESSKRALDVCEDNDSPSCDEQRKKVMKMCETTRDVRGSNCDQGIGGVKPKSKSATTTNSSKTKTKSKPVKTSTTKVRNQPFCESYTEKYPFIVRGKDAFSVVRKNKTEVRAKLGLDTLEAIVVTKSMQQEAFKKEYKIEDLKDFKSAYYRELKKYE